MQDVLIFAVVGFLAQLVDGALGMAFGVITTSSLLAFGLPPATASAVTHVAEIFTTAASGTSHVIHRNIDWRLVLRLAPAGMLGGVIGAYLLSNLDGEAIAPFVSLYLVGIGIYIIFKAFRPMFPRSVNDRLIPVIGVSGGTLDAMGGGGWGSIVTTSLIGRGHDPKKVIGSTSLTELLVTLTVSLTFILTLGWSNLGAAAGLILGGVIAAPFGAMIVRKVPVKPLMIAVALVIIATSVYRFLL